jgi:hypothetical protein
LIPIKCLNFYMKIMHTTNSKRAHNTHTFLSFLCFIHGWFFSFYFLICLELFILLSTLNSNQLGKVKTKTSTHTHPPKPWHLELHTKKLRLQALSALLTSIHLMLKGSPCFYWTIKLHLVVANCEMMLPDKCTNNLIAMWKIIYCSHSKFT